MSNTAEFVSLNGLATALGLTYKSAKKHVTSGLWKPVTHGANKGKFNLERCRDLWEMSRDPIAVEKGDAAKSAAGIETGSATASPLTQARTMHQVFAAKERELRFKKAQGKVIDREEAERAAAAVISVINERLEGAASQIAVRVAGISSVSECERVAREVLRQVRAELAGIGEAVEQVGADA